MTLTSELAFTVEIDWDDSGMFDGGDEDVSAAALYPLQTTRGRQAATDEFGAGSCSFSLRNRDGKYTPFNASSALYPNVLPGRDCRIQVDYNSVTYPVFRGAASPLGMDSGVERPVVEFEVLDAFERLRLGRTNTAVLTDQRVDEIITAILDDISWPAGLRDLDVAVETLDVFTNHNRLPINALQLAAKQELGGAVFIARDGDLTFQNRDYRSTRSVSAILSGTFETLSPDLRQEDIVADVRGEYARFELESALSVVFSLNLPRSLPPGDTTFDIEVTGPGASNYQTPVAVTDYDANASKDGSGGDKTNQVSFVIDSSDSGGATLTATNIDASAVWLTRLDLRAFALKRGEESNFVYAQVASPIVTGQRLLETFEFNTSEDAVGGWVRFQAAARSGDAPRPLRATLELVPDTECADGARPRSRDRRQDRRHRHGRLLAHAGERHLLHRAHRAHVRGPGDGPRGLDALPPRPGAGLVLPREPGRAGGCPLDDRR